MDRLVRSRVRGRGMSHVGERVEAQIVKRNVGSGLCESDGMDVRDREAQRETSLVQFAFDDCLHASIIGSLNPQEVGVAVQSIRTPVQVRYVTGDHFFVTSRQVPFGKMESI